ncbi:MAG TPA: hypothetical protein VEL79_09035 [Vicinamibacterales bacterium]|nr:hypothetical protein [Vicinamibacterales bacterium]
MPRDRRDEPQLTDAQIEAIIADAMAMEASIASAEAAPPSSAIVWWRAQMRARQEAARVAERPLTIVHALAVACGAGLVLSLIGTAFAGVRGSIAWLLDVCQSLSSAVAPLAAIDFTSRWVTLPMTAILISLVIASLAAVVILADE